MMGFWGFGGGKQLTSRRRRQRGPEAGADGFVQGGVFGEVVLGGEFGEPKAKYFLWIQFHSCEHIKTMQKSNA